MSALNDQIQLDSAEDVLAALLAGVIGSVDEERVHDFKLDRQVLNAVYDNDVQPLLNYLVGYQHMDTCQPYHPRAYHDQEYRKNESWIKFLAAAGEAGAYKRVLLVLSETMLLWSGGGHPERARVAVWLGRDGRWFFWFRLRDTWEGTQRVEHQQFAVFQTVNKLLDYVESHLEGYEFSAGFRDEKPKKPLYLPLRIVLGLFEQLDLTIARRQEIQVQFKQSRTRAKKRVKFVALGERRSYVNHT